MDHHRSNIVSIVYFALQPYKPVHSANNQCQSRARRSLSRFLNSACQSVSWGSALPALPRLIKLQILASIQSAIILSACSYGLGKSIELLSDKNLIKVQQVRFCRAPHDTAPPLTLPQMYYVSILFFVISLGLSKISVAFLLLHLTPKKEHGRFLHVIIVLIAAWTVASTFAVALQCNLSHPWILIQETCQGAVTAYTSRPSGELQADPHAVPAMAGHFRLRYLL